MPSEGTSVAASVVGSHGEDSVLEQVCVQDGGPRREREAGRWVVIGLGPGLTPDEGWH